MLEVSLSTMWARGRCSRMAPSAGELGELGFTHVEPNVLMSPGILNELLRTTVPVSSIHSPCPAVLSSQAVPVSSLYLSSLDASERVEAVSFARKTIDLAVDVGARAIVLHMCEVPNDPSSQDRLYKLHEGGYTQTKEHHLVRDRLVHQRVSLAHSYIDAAKKSLQELSQHSQQKGIILGLESRFHFYEAPNMDEMAELLGDVSERLAGYWHDVGHTEVQQQLGFSFHEEWLSRFRDKMVGIHVHDIRGTSDHYAPGKGNMNWEMIARYLPQTIMRVCEIGEWNDEEEMREVVQFV